MWRGVSFISRVAAVFGSDGYFAVECSPQAEVPHQWSHRVAESLSDGETVADKGWSRPEGPGAAESRDKAFQHGHNKNRLRAELQRR